MEKILAAFAALRTTPETRYADAPRAVPVGEPSPEEWARHSTSQVLAKAFAQLSAIAPPQVAEPIELLWRNAARARDGRNS